jgi:hypothetical protein
MYTRDSPDGQEAASWGASVAESVVESPSDTSAAASAIDVDVPLHWDGPPVPHWSEYVDVDVPLHWDGPPVPHWSEYVDAEPCVDVDVDVEPKSSGGGDELPEQAATTTQAIAVKTARVSSRWMRIPAVVCNCGSSSRALATPSFASSRGAKVCLEGRQRPSRLRRPPTEPLTLRRSSSPEGASS